MSRKKKSRSRKTSRASRRRKRQFPSFEKLEDRRLLAATAKIGDIEGGSLLADHEGASDILQFGFEFSAEFEPYDGSGGDGTLIEKSFSDVYAIKDYDKATPKLLTQSLLGKISPTASVKVFGDGVPEPEFRLDLSNIVVTEFSTKEDEASGQILEDIEIAFSALEFGFKDLDTNGNFETEQIATFDLVNDTVAGTAEFFNEDVTDGLSLTIGKSELAIEDFNWDAFGNGKIGSRQTPGDIDISRRIDASTPALLKAAMSGESLADSIVLQDQFESNGQEQVALKWTLHDPKISHFGIDVDESSGQQENDFSIFFSKIELEQTSYKADGSVFAKNIKTWDIKAGTATVGTFPSSSQLEDNEQQALDRLIFPGDQILEFSQLAWEFENDLEVSIEDGFPNKATASAGNLNFTAPLDTMTPGIVAALAAPVSIPTFSVEMPSTSQSLELENAKVRTVDIAHTGDQPTITFSMSFDKITTEATIEDSGGNEQTYSASWDHEDGASKNGFASAVLEAPDDQPDLKLEFSHKGIVTEIAIDSVTWDAFVDQGIESNRPIANDFVVSARSGFHSPGLFEAVAAAEFVPGGTAKITRFGGEDSDRKVQYSWEFSDFYLEQYSTTFESGLGTDRFSIGFNKIKLTESVLAPGPNEGPFRETIWNVLEGEVESPSLDIGQNLLDENPENYIDFGGDQYRMPVSSFTFDASRETDFDNVLSQGDPTAGDLAISTTGIPSAGALYSLAKKGVPVGVDSAKLVSGIWQGDNKLPVETWEFAKKLSVTRFEFEDSVGSSGASMNYAFDYPEVETTFNQYDDSQGINTGSSDFKWDLGNNEISGNSNFGNTTFENPFPDHVLEFPDGKQISLTNFSFTTSRPANQIIGSGELFDRLRVHQINRSQFTMSADSGLATAGLIGSFDSLDPLSKLKITSYRTIAGTTDRTPYRTWELGFNDNDKDKDRRNGVFLENIDILNTETSKQIALSFNIAKLTSTVIPIPDSGSSSSPSRGGSPEVFTGFVDYISPPVPAGITDLQTHNIHDLTLNLQDLFTDEQEPTEDLEYTFTVDNDPGVFISATMDANNVVTLDIDPSQTGIATITVSATDSFDNTGTKTFDVLVTDVAGFLNVTTALDVVSDTDGLTSLREAINFANSTFDADGDGNAIDTITIPAGFNQGPTIITTEGFSITSPLSIVGPGADQLTISGSNTHRVFNIDDGDEANILPVSISGVAITDGNATGNGGGILNRENLTLNGVAISGSTASVNGGGLFHATGLLNMFNSLVSDSNAIEGAGIYVDSGVAEVLNTTISGNSALNWGGGITNGGNGASTTVRNATIIGNRTDSDGDGTGTGGGVDVFGANVVVHNSIVAGNVRGAIGSDVPDDIGGALAAGTFNLIGDTTTSGGLTNGISSNIVGNSGSGTIDINTVLDTTLGDNGGPTSTHALVETSPAVDAGSNALAIDAAGSPLTTDQRGDGFDRFFDALGSGTARVDIGAFELDAIAPSIESVVINGGETQRSMVQEIVITFNEVVIADSSSFMIEDLDSGVCFAPVVTTEETVDGKTIATLTFSGAGIINGSLADGNYRLTTLDTITDASGNQLDGNGDGSAGDNRTDDFFRLYGDASGTGNVNVFDLLTFRTAFGSVIGDSNFDEDLDYGGDGRVNVLDLLQFRNRFGSTI